MLPDAFCGVAAGGVDALYAGIAQPAGEDGVDGVEEENFHERGIVSGGHEHADAEVDDESDDVVGRGDERPGGQGRVNL